MAFSRRQAQHGESGQGHIAASSVKPLRGARHQRFGTGTTSDRTPGPRAGTSPCHCPIADPHRQLSTLYHQTVHRGTVNVGTWNVRGLKVQKHVHKPVDVSLTLTSKDITVCAIQETWLDPNRHRHDPGFSYVGLLGTQLRLDPGGTGFLIKQDVMGCVTQLLKGQKFDQATWVRLKSKSRQNSRVCTPYFADAPS
jgi:hypothetical protein